MSTFAFIPRSIKRRKVDAVTSQNPVSKPRPITSSTAGAQTEEAEAQPNPAKGQVVPTWKGIGDEDSELLGDALMNHEHKRPNTNASKSKHKPMPKDPDSLDLAILICLALSEHSLWSDVDLRRKIDWGPEHDLVDDEAVIYDDRGYVPLAHILQHSAIFRLASSYACTNQPETTYVKALRTHASDNIDVRLIVTSDITSVRAPSSQWPKKVAPAGYEVRRKDFAMSKDSEISRFGKADWDGLMVYFENIPVQYRHPAGIVRLITTLLPSSSTSRSLLTRVQSISLPSHHQDTPGAIPVCKGFATVTLSSKDDVQTLLGAWPWDTSSSKSSSTSETDVGNDKVATVQKEAQKFGLRTLRKSRWDELKAEYLLYRQHLVDEINHYQDEETSRRMQTENSDVVTVTADGGEHLARRSLMNEESSTGPTVEVQARMEPQIHANSPYPPGCLVFVRNVHPDTNKTTLRALFSEASREIYGDTGNGVDYVDYTKNMDTCYIRLTTPSHAQHLVGYFSKHFVAQESGLDGGASQTASTTGASSSVNAISPELVLGKREEVYWEKVPEKVRKQAVGKALALMDMNTTPETLGRTDAPGILTKRKRRRKA